MRSTITLHLADALLFLFLSALFNAALFALLFDDAFHEIKKEIIDYLIRNRKWRQ